MAPLGETELNKNWPLLSGSTEATGGVGQGGKSRVLEFFVLDVQGMRLGLKVTQGARQVRTMGREGKVGDTGRDGIFPLERSGDRGAGEKCLRIILEN